MIADQVTKYVKREKMVTNRQYCSTGSDILDLVTGGGYEFGTIVNIIGDSSSGKSFLSCEAIYQAKKAFGDKVKIKYNDPENGMKFDTEALYGFSMQEAKTSTKSIQDLLGDIGSFANSLKKDEYGFYVVDSFDALASDDDLEEYGQRVKANEEGKEYKKGSYEMQKAKFASKLFRTLSTVIEDKKIILFIISQIRDNVNGGLFAKKWTVSGGKGLKFYSTTRLFLKSVDKYEVEGRKIGYTANVEALKSRCKYPNRDCNVNFLFEYGMDRTGSNIDYLFDLREDKTYKLKGVSVTNNIAWKDNTEEVSTESLKEFLDENELLDKATEEIKAQEKPKNRMTQGNIIDWIRSDPELYSEYVEKFGVLSRDDLIQYIEENDLEDVIGERAVAKWMAIEERIKPKRKRKSL